jgi:UDP-N-acetylglucosamine 1-carboxyvinyltransferase
MDTRVYPFFVTDLQAPFALLLTKAEGKSKIFETIFEGRLGYLDELEKMGASTEILNPHQAIIFGPSSLKGTELQSYDLRAGATMVLAALGARGESKITGINYIDRGYENFENKLKKLGANIERVNI